jgi:hypothetical protein
LRYPRADSDGVGPVTDGRRAAGRSWRHKVHLTAPEVVMNSAIHHQIMQARVADRHHQAQQDALARAARQADRPARHQSRRRVLRLPVVTARRALTA